MASLSKFIEELQAIEDRFPGSDIEFGTRFGDHAFPDYQVVLRRLSKKRYRGGVRWVAESGRGGVPTYVVEPKPRGRK